MIYIIINKYIIFIEIVNKIYIGFKILMKRKKKLNITKIIIYKIY